MKRYIFPLLLCGLLLGTDRTNAQAITGSFKSPLENNTPSLRPVNVNYTVTLSPGKDKLSIILNSTDVTNFIVNVMGSNNKIVAQWTPSASNIKFNHDFDLSKLPSGDYHLNFSNIHSGSGNHNPGANNAQSMNASAHRPGNNNNLGNNSTANANSIRPLHEIKFTK